MIILSYYQGLVGGKYMIKNTEENMKILEEYINTRDFDEIKITDLINFFAMKAGVKIKQREKMQRIENLIHLKKNVLFVLVDGLGAYKVADLDESSILRKNIVSAIDTVNPTSTACVLTSLCSGLEPSEHGILGWWNYSHSKKLEYYPLLMKERNTGIDLKEKGINAKDIFQFDNIFDKFKCEVNIYMKRDIINSDFSKMFSGRKSNRFGCYSIKEAFKKIDNKLTVTKEPSFNYLYISGLDNYSHMYGTKSYEVLGIIKEIEDGLNLLKENHDDLTMVVTADHGQIDMSKYIYLNEKNDYTQYFYASPSIDTRIISFFVKEECKEEFETKFSNEFYEDVILLTKEQFIDYKILGKNDISKVAQDALGEYIAIIVKDKFLIGDKLDLKDYIYTKGNHSGINKFETNIPLIVI
jgi:predicted AlkP superfamily pyrophosphatase or phosphodiesterase